MPYNSSGRATNTPSWSYDISTKERNDAKFRALSAGEISRRLLATMSKHCSGVFEDASERDIHLYGKKYIFQFQGNFLIHEINMRVPTILYVEVEPSANPDPYDSGVSLDTTMELVMHFGNTKKGVTFNEYIANQAVQNVIRYWPSFTKAFNYQFRSSRPMKANSPFYQIYTGIISLQSFFQYRGSCSYAQQLCNFLGAGRP